MSVLDDKDVFTHKQCAKNIHANTPEEKHFSYVSCYLEEGHDGECQSFWKVALLAVSNGTVSRKDFTELVDAASALTVDKKSERTKAWLHREVFLSNLETRDIINWEIMLVRLIERETR